VIENLLQLIPKHLSEGRIIRLGDFGSFGVRINGSGSETEGTFSKNRIKKLKLEFRPGQEIRKALDNAVIQKT